MNHLRWLLLYVQQLIWCMLAKQHQHTYGHSNELKAISWKFNNICVISTVIYMTYHHGDLHVEISWPQYASHIWKSNNMCMVSTVIHMTYHHGYSHVEIFQRHSAHHAWKSNNMCIISTVIYMTYHHRDLHVEIFRRLIPHAMGSMVPNSIVVCLEVEQTYPFEAALFTNFTVC
jgi:hypothetical protein